MKSVVRVVSTTLAISLVVLLVILFLSVQPQFSKVQKVNFSRDLIDSDALKIHVKKLSVDMIPRDFLHPENLNRVADYIRTEFKKNGIDAVFQTFTVNKRQYQNVVARLGPADGPVIVIGAHYDACQELPAADDNASGVAGLLELARVLSKQKLKTAVEFVAYTLEEPPYFGTESMGSAFHAENLKKKNIQVKAMISIEMIGYFSDQHQSQDFPSSLLKLFYPSTGNFITVVGDISNRRLTRNIRNSLRAGSDMPAYSMNAPQSIPGIDFSDQLSYWHRNFPGVMVTDTAFYRNKAYHTELDTYDRLDYNRMAQVVSGLHQAVLDLEK